MTGKQCSARLNSVKNSLINSEPNSAMSKTTFAEQPATASIASPSPKLATSSNSNRLTPSEMESLRKEMREAAAWAKRELAKHD